VAASSTRDVVSGTAAPLFEIPFEAEGAVRATLGAMGRTEDVRLSPDGRRLAIACYARNRVLLVEIRVERTPTGPIVALGDLREVSSPALHEPHGVDFLDDDTLVVSNRSAGVTVFRITDHSGDVASTEVARNHGSLESPGSVAVRHLGGGRHEALVCNNWGHTVTRHTIAGDGELSHGEVVARRFLDVPDGVAISRDGRWVAVSNHNTHSVLVYAGSTLGEDAEPVGVLRGVLYPHGLRFTGDDRQLLVADAGAPYVHVFAAANGDWHWAGYPAASVRVMSDEVFARGRYNPTGGGPKGIDIDPRTGVLVVTSEHFGLGFFDLTAVLECPGDVTRDEDALRRYELHALETIERQRQTTANAVDQLHAIQQTKAWRLMEPARRLYRTVRRLRPRR
jgi:Lipoprotein LpqB beta-propeller domain